MSREKNIKKAVAACAEFECDNCPYNYLSDNHYMLRCIHVLMNDINKLLNKKEKEFLL